MRLKVFVLILQNQYKVLLDENRYIFNHFEHKRLISHRTEYEYQLEYYMCKDLRIRVVFNAFLLIGPHYDNIRGREEHGFAVGHFQMVAILGGEVKSSHQWESVIRRVFRRRTVPAD